MTISKQTNPASAEQITRSAQHIEYANINDSGSHAGVDQQQQADTDTGQHGFVGPWPLRRSSISSWTVISGESGIMRGSVLSCTGDSASMNSATNPFAASSGLENDFSEEFRSEASSSKMMEGSVDVIDSRPPSGISELTLTLEQVDQQSQTIQNMLKGETTAASNDDAEGGKYEFKRFGGEQLADDPTDSEKQEQYQAAQNPRITSPQRQLAIDIEHRAATIALSQLEADDCRGCKEQASPAFAGKCMLGVTAAILGASPYLIYYFFREEFTQASAMMKEKHKTFLFLSLLAVPVTSALSMIFLGWLGLNSLGPTRRRLSGGVEYFQLWMCFVVLTSCCYFFIAALTYRYVN